MKEMDDTPLPENESERPWTPDFELSVRMICEIHERLEALQLRIANLETQRTPQDENPDPEWYS